MKAEAGRHHCASCIRRAQPKFQPQPQQQRSALFEAMHNRNRLPSFIRPDHATSSLLRARFHEGQKPLRGRVTSITIIITSTTTTTWSKKGLRCQPTDLTVRPTARPSIGRSKLISSIDSWSLVRSGRKKEENEGRMEVNAIAHTASAKGGTKCQERGSSEGNSE